jgi:hypothetical protein
MILATLPVARARDPFPNRPGAAALTLPVSHRIRWRFRPKSIAHRAARHSRTGASAPAAQKGRLRSLSDEQRGWCPVGWCRQFACIPEPGGRHGPSSWSTPKAH